MLWLTQKQDAENYYLDASLSEYMTLKQYLIILSLCSVAGWFAWSIVLFNVNPFETGFIGFVLFYASLLVAFIGTLSFLGFITRLAIFRESDIVLRQATTAFRQACFLSLIMVGSLFLLSVGLLRLWNVALFIVTGTILELFFISFKLNKVRY